MRPVLLIRPAPARRFPGCKNHQVVPAKVHDFFAASAGVAGTLIGLLFVAISVASGRLRAEVDGQVHRIRAVAALTAFTNSLSVSLFSLIPGAIGPTAISVAATGLAFILASLLSLVRLRQVRWTIVRDALFLIGLAVIFVIELIEGIDIINAQAGNSGAVDDIAILVVICFLLGIARSWELIGGPSIGIGHEVAALVRAHQASAGDPQEGPAPPAPPAAPDAGSAER